MLALGKSFNQVPMSGTWNIECEPTSNIPCNANLFTVFSPNLTVTPRDFSVTTSHLDNMWGVVGAERIRAGEDRSRGCSRGSSDVSRSRGSSQEVNTKEGGEELITRWDLGSVANEHKTFFTQL